ncbi:MAG: penicillin-binding protein 1C [Spirochaetia bacterium]|nr:penicillin-binding protein 1C [Spirochaetia bacterium]
MIFTIFFLILGFNSGEVLSNPILDNLKAKYVSSESNLLDRNGKILHTLRTNTKERKLNWVSLDEVSQNFIDTILIAEDKRFFEHRGVDWLALGSGIFRFIAGYSPRGASTITMQLSSFLNDELKPINGRRSISQKWNQILGARRLEEEWTKSEILEAYVNLVNFKGELIGIDSASRGYFGKLPHGLSQIESIVLTSMIKSPSGSKERILQRSCYLFKFFNSEEDCSSIKEKVEEVYSKNYKIKHPYRNAFHLAHKLLTIHSDIETTLDFNIQIFAELALKKHLTNLKNQNVKDGAILVKDNKTNEILAYIGSSGNLSSSMEVDGVLAKRQAGSTLKPFLYALAFEKKYITPLSTLKDTPIEIQSGSGLYIPNNYKDNYNGDVQSRIALGSSLNIPAIRVLELVGLDEFLGILEKLNFTNLKEPEHYGFSIALGSLDVSLWELVNAYSTFANKGIYTGSKITSLESITPMPIYSPAVSFLISDILSDRGARALTFGLNSPLSTRYGASVKTGTSKDMRDNWCIGYTENFTVGVWVGNYTGEPMWNVSGITGSAPIWLEVMNFLMENKKILPPSPPNDIVEITFSNGKSEYFLKGTEVFKYPEINSILYNYIENPIQDSFIAIDPDIPNTHQKVYFKARILNPHNSWRLNGKIVGDTSTLYLWEPQRGTHILELVDNKFKVIDKVDFIVK